MGMGSVVNVMMNMFEVEKNFFNSLSIHMGEDQWRSILLHPKLKTEMAKNLNIVKKRWN